MQDTLSVVHPLHGYDESFALVSEMQRQFMRVA
jgi:hypothetical protein